MLAGSSRGSCHFPKHGSILFWTKSPPSFRSYAAYYHNARTHRSLDNDCPVPRSVEPPEIGAVIAFPQVGGLHHRYRRRLAA